MKSMPYVCLYLSYLHTLEPLSDVIRGKLLLAMLQYAQTGKQPQLHGHAKLLWPGFQDQIDRDMAKYRKRCAQNKVNGEKGGRPPKTEHNQTVSQKAKEKEKEKDIENKKENKNENANNKANNKANENANKNETQAPEGAGFESTPISFFPPSYEQVKQYIRESGLKVDPEAFLDYYTSNGWMVGQSPMQDWKASIRRWHRKENEHGKTVLPPESYQYGTVL